MSSESFNLRLGALVALICLSATQAIGTIIGLFTAFALVFFVIPLNAIVVVASGLDRAMTARQLGLLAAVIGGMVVLALLVAAYFAFAHGRAARGRVLALKAAVLAALPLICWLSLRSMAEAWP